MSKHKRSFYSGIGPVNIFTPPYRIVKIIPSELDIPQNDLDSMRAACRRREEQIEAPDFRLLLAFE